jgi:Sensors of blue-light using FAD
MLIRLIYVSTAADGLNQDVCSNILSHAQQKNTRADLTGMLAFNTQKFLQVLEGNRETVNALYTKLLSDRRHNKVEILGCKEIEERLWSDWSMGLAVSNNTNRSLFLKYSTRSEFNPYLMKADAAEKLLIELTKTSIEVTNQKVKAPEIPKGNFFTKMIG